MRHQRHQRSTGTDVDFVGLHMAQETKLISGSGVRHTVATNDGVGQVQDLTSVAGVCECFRVSGGVNTHRSLHKATYEHKHPVAQAHTKAQMHVQYTYTEA